MKAIVGNVVPEVESPLTRLIANNRAFVDGLLQKWVQVQVNSRKLGWSSETGAIRFGPRLKPRSSIPKRGGSPNAPPRPEAIPGSDWEFKPDVDLDWRNAPGDEYQNLRNALDEAFNRTGVPKDAFSPTKWGRDKYGKSFPTEYRTEKGEPYSGAEVNIDDPQLVPVGNGPADQHVGYQTPGKRNQEGNDRGHIILPEVPVSRGQIGEQ